MNEIVDQLTQLIELENDIAKAKSDQAKAKKAYDRVRDEAFAIIDKVAGEGKAYRMLSDATGKLMVIGRTISPSEPQDIIDVPALRKLISAEDWDAISDIGPRRLNEDKLAGAVEEGRIDQSVLDLVSSQEAQVARLRYDVATKQEIEEWEEDKSNSAIA